MHINRNVLRRRNGKCKKIRSNLKPMLYFLQYVFVVERDFTWPFSSGAFFVTGSFATGNVIVAVSKLQ